MSWLAALLLSAQAPVDIPVNNHECLKTCAIDQAGLDVIRRFEGYSPVAYADTAGKLTIGVGHLIAKGEEYPRPLTPDEADALLQADSGKAAAGVNRHVSIKLQQHEFNALASFTFNLGEGALAGSTLLKYVNAGRDDLVPAQFRRWCNAGGKPVTGLIRRRQAEAEMYVG